MSAIGMMRQRVLVAKRTGSSVSAVEEYGVDVAYRARVEPMSRMMAGAEGQVRSTTARVFLPPEADIEVSDRITLPGGAQPPIMSIGEQVDGRGAARFKVVLV